MIQATTNTFSETHLSNYNYQYDNYNNVINGNGTPTTTTAANVNTHDSLTNGTNNNHANTIDTFQTK